VGRAAKYQPRDINVVPQQEQNNQERECNRPQRVDRSSTGFIGFIFRFATGMIIDRCILVSDVTGKRETAVISHQVQQEQFVLDEIRVSVARESTQRHLLDFPFV